MVRKEYLTVTTWHQFGTRLLLDVDNKYGMMLFYIECSRQYIIRKYYA